jgi:hypothetical protein
MKMRVYIYVLPNTGFVFAIFDVPETCWAQCCFLD